MPQADAKPICYSAVHRRGLDEKRRLQVPAKWYRKTAEGKPEDIEYAMILWEYDGQPDMFVQVLPPDVFQKLWDKVTEKKFGDAEGQALTRTLGEKMEMVTLDSAGRITLPEWMVKAAGLEIGKEAVMNGMFNHFQIWSPERYEATRASTAAKASIGLRSI